jgi:hypothetical protein
MNAGVSMQIDEAKKLRINWGNKHCEHLHFEKEYDRGAHTGDYVCTTCGKVFLSREEAEQSQNNFSE